MSGSASDIPDSADNIEMIGLGEFARRMDVCPNTVRNWIKDGKLMKGEHYLHIGHIYRFPWGPEFLRKLMRSLAPESSPARPNMHSLAANRGRLRYQA